MRRNALRLLTPYTLRVFKYYDYLITPHPSEQVTSVTGNPISFR